MAKTLKPGSRTLGPRRQAQTFHHDILGESKMAKKPNGRTFGQDMTGGEGAIPADGLGPGKRKRRPANAAPSGGGGGGWAAMNDKMAANRAKMQASDGLAIGTRSWVQGKIDEGDIEGGLASGSSGTSIFDPVLCEIAYRWFCPPCGAILDPFAGGSVRGVVASRLGLAYYGVELRREQVMANRSQLGIAGEPAPQWIEGDSRNLPKLFSGAVDMVFSCPPYWNLEVYSEDERDLSTFDVEEFFAAQADIIAKACAFLKPNRFAVWITSDVRDADGFYIGLPGRTIDAFRAAGARLYNECILVTAAGSLPIRVRKQFEGGRKLGRTHQNALVFCKGDWKKAVAALGPVEFGEGVEEALAPAAPAPPPSAPAAPIAPDKAIAGMKGVSRL